jgi:hypothetical protein
VVDIVLQIIVDVQPDGSIVIPREELANLHLKKLAVVIIEGIESKESFYKSIRELEKIKPLKNKNK